MTKQIIVADTGPLIAFARVKQLELLKELFGSVLIPHTVMQESLVDIAREDAGAIQNAIKQKIIKVVADPQSTISNYLNSLDAGETAAIALAEFVQAPLLIDEKKGRLVAQKLQLKVIGTLGVLLRAKKYKLIKKVYPLIQQFQKNNYYFSAELVREVLKQAKETRK